MDSAQLTSIVRFRIGLHEVNASPRVTTDGVVRDAAHDGAACTDVLMEVVVCNDVSCMRPGPCVMGSRQKWVGCDSYKPTQKVRSRSILKPAYLGELCTDHPLEETEGCEQSVTECLTQWSSWVKSDKL